MTAKNESSSGTAGRELTLSRIFDAPRELVWKAMTDPKQVVQWWGPYGFKNTIETMDLRPGGDWKYTMHGPDGTNYVNHSVFTKIVPGELVVFHHRGSKIGDKGVDFEGNWHFEALDEAHTRVTVRMVFESNEELERVADKYGARAGLTQTLSRLREMLTRAGAGPGEVFVISREFDAPRDMIWQAWTDPQQLEKWWGPKGCSVSALKYDFRPEGVFHYGMKTPDGKGMFGKWLYREIDAPARIVVVSSFTDADGKIVRHPFVANWPLELLTTITFTEEKGRTTVTIYWVPIRATAEERTVFMKNHESMQKGWTGTLEQFADFLSKR